MMTPLTPEVHNERCGSVTSIHTEHILLTQPHLSVFVELANLLRNCYRPIRSPLSAHWLADLRASYPMLEPMETLRVFASAVG